MSTCLEGVRPRNVEYREYYENNRKVKEYRINIELSTDTDEGDPVSSLFLLHMLSILFSENMGGGKNRLAIVLCQTNNPPSCPSIVPPNGKALSPISNYQGDIGVESGTNYRAVTISAVDSSTDSYSWNNIILQWATSATFDGFTYGYIAYVSTSGNKGATDIIRITFTIKLSASSMF